MQTREAEPPVIQLANVYRTYEMGDQILNALDGVDLEIARNEYIAIIGASGSGKSTMMNIIGCLDRVSKGDYLLNGTNVGDMSETELARARNREIGFVFQSFNCCHGHRHLKMSCNRWSTGAFPVQSANVSPPSRLSG